MILPTYSDLLNRTGFGTFTTRPDAGEGEFRVAGFNIQTAFLTDSQKNGTEFPKYCWDNRAKPMVQLIQQDRPAVLAICEFNIPQAITFRESLKDQYTLIGYSSEMNITIEDVEERIKTAEKKRLSGEDVRDPRYDEFVGFLVDNETFEIITDSIKCHELPRGARHGRVLIEVELIHRATKTHLIAFSSHFDHLSLESRERAGIAELKLILQHQKDGMPCITFGDRNWFPDVNGQECYEAYIKSGLLTDIRNAEEGHYGPKGTFPGHLDLPEKFAPKFVTDDFGHEIIDANTLDVGFVTKEFEVKHSYSYYGSFDPESGELLSNENPGDLRKKNFVSDHFYTGATVKLKNDLT